MRYVPDMENRNQVAAPRRRKGKTYAAPLDRLTTPMVRDDGVLRPATWDEALGRAAAGFAKIRDEDGPGQHDRRTAPDEVAHDPEHVSRRQAVRLAQISRVAVDRLRV